MLYIKKGKVIIYRIYDVASEIDLSLIEELAKEGVRRLRLSRYPYMKALEFTNPPVSLDLKGFEKELQGINFKVSIVAKAYDFGVISLAFNFPVSSISFSDLERIARALDTDESIDSIAIGYINHLIKSFSRAMTEPEIKETVLEDYMIFYIEELSEMISADEFLKLYDPSRLLLYEDKPLSEYAKEETLKHRFSYYPDDLVILHLDNALIIDPRGDHDIVDILEFANAQILELRYYDSVLDKELQRIYNELSSRGGISIFKIREYERLARNLTETVTDLTEVTEKINNALKVTEDVYYAKIYQTAMMLFRSQDWESSINEKLSIVSNTYKMIYDEISTKRGHILELGIFLLIVLEILLAIL
ncbi:MAG: hypothetical protein GXO97_03025 [Nitrospirae bacterium]|nr:hypothetical protein [Nitrospirota bacterium]